MDDHKFNPKKLEKLNDPRRLKMIPPDRIWEKFCKGEDRSDSVLLDIGAGTGLFSRAFSDLMKSSGDRSFRQIHALDISEVMIGWMEDNVVPDYPDIIPRLMGESQIPLTDSIADFALMITLHHELEAPAALLSEVFRVLKPGGRVAIVDWKNVSTPFGPPVEIRVPAEEIAGQLESAGFTGIEVDSGLEMMSLVVGEKV